MNLLFYVVIFFGSAMEISYGDVFKAGVGIADVTGPAGEVFMMGYAKDSQKSAGIHIRLYSRAFAFQDSNGNCAVYVSVDVGMISQLVKTQVVETLKDKLNGVYNEKNILISATHTHSSSGGFHQYMLYSIATLGFSEDTFHAHVTGIVQSIINAHNAMQPARILFNAGNLYNASINRSPSSYLLNPAEERQKYGLDVDTEMQVLKLVRADSEEAFGAIVLFPVHGTSMNNTNLLISGDNKGYASQLLERDFNKGALPGHGSFVAAFGQANEGDVSPNTAGSKCIDTGLPCDILTSACGKSVAKCIASGPGKDMEDSCRIIGTLQYQKAKKLLDSAVEELKTDSVSYVHQFVDMTNYKVTVGGAEVTTCPPAMGYSFAAGTTDGPGVFNFLQGDTSDNKLWNLISSFLSKPSDAQIKCHGKGVKPILLNTGFVNFPTPWQPSIVETQMFKIGNVIMVALPGEFTTMSGRRIREKVEDVLTKSGVKDSKVLLAGLSNTYTSYITTYEEYQAQRYEAASTIYGPHTLSAYIDQFSKLTSHLATKASLPPGPNPPYLLDTTKKWSFITPVVVDSAGIGKEMGDVITQPQSSYTNGQTASARFITGHPRNDPMLERTFLTIERRNDATAPSSAYTVVCTDANIETKFHWIRTNVVLGRSEALITWDIPNCAKPGVYRIRHFGYWKGLFQSPKSFSGTSKDFTVKAKTSGIKASDLINSNLGCGCV